MWYDSLLVRCSFCSIEIVIIISNYYTMTKKNYDARRSEESKKVNIVL